MTPLPFHHVSAFLCLVLAYLLYKQWLTLVFSAMRNCCSTINVSHMQRCSSSMSSLSSLESIPMKSFSSSSSSTNSAAASVVSSIDTEVLEMQKRLVFPDNVRVRVGCYEGLRKWRNNIRDRKRTNALIAMSN